MYLLEVDTNKRTYNSYITALQEYNKAFRQFLNVALFQNSNGVWIKLK